MINENPKIHDQYTDRSGREFVKMASRLASRSAREQAMEVFSALPDRLSKLAQRASFPVDTPEDTFISRIYFEGEKHLMKEAEANDVEARLAVRERLYGIDRPRFKQMRKTAAEKRVELIPGVEVANYSELQKLGEDFDRNYRQLDYQDRIDFSVRFAKYACAEDVPPSVRMYAGVGVKLRDDAVEQLEFRKAAALRIGRAGTMYEKIAEAIENTPKRKFTPNRLWKLAEAVHSIDEMFGFTETAYDKRMPDAWHALMKSADEEEDDKKISDESEPLMSKSDIVARFGEQALDEIENEDGSVDETKLREIMNLFGDKGDKDKEKKNNA